MSPTPDATARSVVADFAAGQVNVVERLADGVRRDEPDAVHKTRVATRRLRSALRTYRRLLQDTVPLRAELRWFAAELGGSRDAEVLLAHVTDELAQIELGDEAERAAILDALAERQRIAHARLLEALDSPRYEALRESLRELSSDLPARHRADGPADVHIPRAIAAAVRRVERGLAEAERDPSDFEAWHELRKLTKAARYAFQGVTDVFGDQAKRGAVLWEAVTTAFGDLQDDAVIAQVLADLGEGSTLHDALAARARDRLQENLAKGRAALADALPYSRDVWPGPRD